MKKKTMLFALGLALVFALLAAGCTPGGADSSQSADISASQGPSSEGSSSGGSSSGSSSSGGASSGGSSSGKVPGEVVSNSVPRPDDTASVTTAYAALLPFPDGGKEVFAGVAYLGAAGDAAGLKAAFIEKYWSDLTPEQAAAVATLDAGGADLYVVVPRYEGWSTALYPLTLGEAGDLAAGERLALVEGSLPFFLISNPSDLYPGAAAALTGPGGQTVTATPYLSGKDGTLVVQDGICDLVPVPVEE